MIEALNAAALAKRAALPASNSFPIRELLSMPPYYNWVSCDSGLGKFSMFLGGRDDGVALRFFWNGTYERMTLKTWAWFAKRASIALDIGAHTGAYTLAAKAANPAISVVSFEPYMMNFARLNLNLRANGHDTINSYMMAVGAEEGKLPFSVSTSQDYLTSGGAIGARPNSATTEVNVVAIDALATDDIRTRIGLVKIDTEGFESECIKGMRNVITTARPVIFLECIEPKSSAAVQEHLAKEGYRFFEVDDNAHTIRPVADLAPSLDNNGKAIYGRLNRIALPQGDLTAEMIDHT